MIDTTTLNELPWYNKAAVFGAVGVITYAACKVIASLRHLIRLFFAFFRTKSEPEFPVINRGLATIPQPEPEPADLEVDKEFDGVDPELNRPLDHDWLDRFEKYIRKIIVDGEQSGEYRHVDPYNVLIVIAAAKKSVKQSMAAAPTDGRSILAFNWESWIRVQFKHGEWYRHGKPYEGERLVWWIEEPS